MNKMKHETNTNKQVNTLLIGSFPKTVESIRASLEISGHVVTQVQSLSGLESATENTSFDLIVSSTGSSKFTADELFELTSLLTPGTPVVGFSSNPTPTSVVEFIRQGGVDFFCVPEDLGLISDRVNTILSQFQKSEDLKETAKQNLRLHTSMNEKLQRASDENESLCNDLANTHCETQKQIQQASIAAEFQTLVNQELEIESMLRTALGYLLTRVGATNAAVYLHEGEVEWGIGAYINYDRQPDQFQTLIESVGPQACPLISGSGDVIKYKDGETFANISDVDSADFSGSEVVTMGCFYEDRCMAAIVLFRGDTKPFDQESLDTLETIKSIFGYQLGTILKIHRRAETKWPSESIDDDEWNYGKAA